MNFNPAKEIFRKVKQKGINIQCVCEVGVYLPPTSNVIDFIKKGIKTILVEPDPKSINAIKLYFKDYPNVILYPFAIYEYNGKISLSKAEASTFVTDLPSSPALVNDNYKIDRNESFEVECKLFSEIDNGDIDLLSIDTEGCEWYVLQTIKSLPKVISIETHGKYYSNPFMSKINGWIIENNYKIWYKDKSDTVYYRSDVLQLTMFEKFHLRRMDVYLWLKKNKRLIVPGKK